MKFFSDVDGNMSVWDGKRVVSFENGVLETNSPNLIGILKRAGYRYEKEEQPETIPEDITSHETDWKSHTKKELMAELTARKIPFDKKDNKAELIKLLEN